MRLIWNLLSFFITGHAYGQLSTLWQLCPLYVLYTLPYERPMVTRDVYVRIPYVDVSRDLPYGSLAIVGPYYKAADTYYYPAQEFQNTNMTEEIKDEMESMNTTTERPPLPPPPRPPPPPLPKPPLLPPPPPPRPSPYFQPPLPMPPPPLPPANSQTILIKPFQPPPPPPLTPSTQSLKRPPGLHPPSYLPYLQPVYYFQTNRPASTI